MISTYEAEGFRQDIDRAARGVVDRRLEGAVAIAQQHADVTAKGVGYHQIGFAVPS